MLERLSGGSGGDRNHVGEAFTYTLDSQDVVQTISGAWDEFARDNGAPDLTVERVTGAQIWDFITDTRVRQLYRLIFDRARDTARPLKVGFHCDSVELIRSYTLEVAPIGGRGFTVTSTQQTVAPRPAGGPRVVPAGGGMLRVCSWCKRVWNDGRWLDVENLISALDIFGGGEDAPEITHGVCDACEMELLEGLEGKIA